MTAPRCGGLIGFGNVAALGHVPGWRATDDFAIVAVADPDAARRALAAETLPGVRTYPTADAMLGSERLDFVDIATPPAAHAPAILAAARAGVHVLCEKPLTTSWDEYRTLRDTARDAGIVLHTVHNWKYSEAFLVVHGLVVDGAIGQLRSVTFDTARNGCAVTTAENWRVQRGMAGGGILVDHGWHAFYLILALARERPQRVSALLERRRYVDAEVEDTVQCTIDFASLRAEIRLTWAANERHTRWHLRGDGGELTVEDDRVVVRGRHGTQSRRLTTALSAGSHHPDWFAGVLDEFRRALDAPSARGINQDEAELCVLLLDRAYASGADNANVLDIPPRDAPGERSVGHA